MIIIKSRKHLRCSLVRVHVHSKQCFVGFSEFAIWGNENILNELDAYENWLKEL